MVILAMLAVICDAILTIYHWQRRKQKGYRPTILAGIATLLLVIVVIENL